MDYFDEMQDAFRRIGLSEAAARLAAIGHDGSEARAREAWNSSRSDDPEDLADRLLAEAASRQGAVSEALSPAAVAVVSAARSALRMSEAEARDLAVRLQVREVRRAGPAHAQRYLETFAAGLRRDGRAVVSR